MPAAHDPLWLTRTHAAQLVGLGPRQFDEAIKPRLPDAAIAGEGRTLRYHAPDVVATWYAYKLEQLRDRQAVGGKDTLGPDALIEDANAPDSPALESLRQARAIDAWLDVDERTQFLVKRQVVLDALRPATVAMRGAGARLTKRFGNEAGKMFNTAVDAFARAIDRYVADASAQPGGPGEHAGAGERPRVDDADARRPDDH